MEKWTIRNDRRFYDREIPNFGEFVNPPEQLNLNNQFIYYRGGNDRENSDREAEQGNIQQGR